MWTAPHSIGWVTLIQVYFITYQKYFCFKYHTHSGQSKIFQTSLSLYRFSTKIIESDHVKFPANISRKYM